jgi:hypothetical protein
MSENHEINEEINNEVKETVETETQQETTEKNDFTAEEHTHEDQPQLDMDAMLSMMFSGMTVYDVMRFMCQILDMRAWENMGLRLPPGEKELKKDLTQAKAAIDTIAFLIDKLHPNSDDHERKMLRDMISSLQLNFVRQSS